MVYTTDQLNHVLSEYMERALKRAPEIEEIWLFGSYVNGEPHDDSDIDLAIISPQFAADYAAAVAHVRMPVWEMEQGANIEVHGFTREDFKSMVLAQEIQQTGRCLYS